MSIADSKNVEIALLAGARQTRNAMIASVLGWSLDLFDLFILLYVAPVVGALFFPSSVPTLSLAAVYASFAVTLFMRPVGSAIFGHYADVRGRKSAMLVAIIGVGVSTAAFGLLPTIAQAGFIAPCLFLILRLVQGVFVGGGVESLMCVSRSWRSSIGLGLPHIRSAPLWVLGNAMTSRIDDAPARSMQVRSQPIAMPPCGGGPKAKASSRNPNLSRASVSLIPSNAKTRSWTLAWWIRIEPPPISLPLQTMS